MASDSHVVELLPNYVLGGLDEEEEYQVFEHLAACPGCRAELRLYQNTVEQLALAAPDAAPSPELADRLMARIAKADSSRRIGPAQTRWWQPLVNFGRRAAPVWGVISLFLIVVLGLSNLLLWQRVNQLETSSVAGVMRTITLKGTADAPYGTGTIIISLDGEHGTLVVDRLPVLSDEQQYQLWLSQNGYRASGGVFSVSKSGYGSVWVSAPYPLASYTDFGVWIEPAGGSADPTGIKVLGGHVANY
jgi:anti-sigma-K factor RskA